MKGSDKITLKLNAIGFGGMMYEVATAVRRDEGQRRRQENRAQGRWRRGPRRDCRRHCGRRFRRGDRRGGRRGNRRCCFRGRRRASAAAGRDTPAVSVERGCQHPIVTDSIASGDCSPRGYPAAFVCTQVSSVSRGRARCGSRLLACAAGYRQRAPCTSITVLESTRPLARTPRGWPRTSSARETRSGCLPD